MKNILRKSNFGFKKWCVALIAAGWIGAAQAAPVSITASGTYTQDFNTLISTGTGTWANDSTIAAWYAQRTGTGTSIAADTGSSTGGNLYSFGSTSSSDRALGSMGSGNAAAGHFAWGVQFQNTSSSTVTIGTVSYTGEEWRKGGNTTASVVTFWYKVSSSAITSLNPSDLVTDDSTTGWTAVTSLNFSSPVNTATGAALDGNASANKVAVSANLNISVPAGSYVMLRWKHPRPASGSSHGLAIDDLSVAYTVPTGGTPPTITGISPSSGLAGTIVTITGTDFTGATAVSFNGVAAASYTVDSATSITATVPSDATTGPISVTTAGGTAPSTVNFTVPALTIAISGGNSINEGDNNRPATVTATPAPTSDLTITLTSSSATDLTVDGGSGAGATATATISANTTEASFVLNAPADNAVDNDASVNLTATAASGYKSASAIVTVRNVDLPIASLTGTGYTETFSTFAAATPTLPLGWSATGSVLTFPSSDNAWGAGFNSGFRGGASVLGYQHTSSTGTLVKTLTLKNETGATITDLTVSYKGRVARASEERSPMYSVTVNGEVVPALAYSTADGDNTTRTASLTGLSIGSGAAFQISWSSNRGLPSNSSKQIGISEVSVTLGATSSAPTLSGLSIPIINVTRTQAQAEANVTADGGAALTKRGFVIAATSVNPNPEIGGTGVTNVEDAGTEVGLMTATFTGLSVGTGYTVKAYAINSVGTSYTVAQSFTTVGAALSFTGTYSESFDSYIGTAPAGWHAVSSTGVQGYGGEWGSGSSGGFRGTGATTGGILGYQPTTTTGDLTVTLSLINNTGATIETLNIGYLGRAARVDQPRISSWAVTLDGQAVADLAYSTDNTSGEAGAPGDETKATQLTGLSIANGTEFTLTWTSPSPTGSGASRQIGLADVVVSTSAPTPAAPSNLSYMPATVSGTVGTAISSLTPTVTGTVDTYSVSPSLPAGLSINSTSGVISGTPTAVAASDTYTVTAANEGGSTTATVTVTVNSADTPQEQYLASYGLVKGTPEAAGTADPDGDGLNNAGEFAFGTSPVDGSSRAVTQTSVTGGIKITWLQRSGVTYEVKSTDNLGSVFSGPVSSSPVSPQPGGLGDYQQYEATLTGGDRGFIKVEAIVP